MKPFEIAFQEFDVREIVGKDDNPEVLKYFAEIGHSWVKDDETAWCSAFVNYCAKKAGYDYSGKLDARSWLKVGKKTDEPKLGDIVVLWREKKKGWKGHVGFFIKKRKGLIYILGGNQSNRVKISAYSEHRLLSYITLSKVKSKKKYL